LDTKRSSWAASTLRKVKIDAGTYGPAPQQARSRAALRRILESAELVLSAEGFDHFTMASVAEHADVSIGAMYRRFTGKEQLLAAVRDRMLSQFESDLTAALRKAEGQGLTAFVDAYTRVLVTAFKPESRLLPELLVNQGPDSAERGRQAMENLQQHFVSGAQPHVDQVRRPDPVAALTTIARTLLGATIHRTVTISDWPDDLSWEVWRTEVTDMALLYLMTSPGERS
jgi:AcrR family transcriptional regulator